MRRESMDGWVVGWLMDGVSRSERGRLLWEVEIGPGITGYLLFTERAR